MASSEHVHLMVNNVRHKKRDGVLYLMSERVAWCPQGKDHFDISYPYSDIKCQKISPDGKSKVQLQVVLMSGESKTFHFASSNTEEAKENRNSVKDILSEMLPKFRRQVDRELEEKNRLLQEDAELFQTYKDLVGSQVITPAEFWASRSKQLPSGDSTQSKQKVGVSASFLSDVKPQSDGCNGLRYNLTADRIESIFKTYPAVKKKYMDKVPDKLTEKEFWTMFFQSHYFHRDRVNQSSKDIFSDCAKKDDQDISTLLKFGVKDRSLNLTNLNDEDSALDEGYGTSSAPVANTGKHKLSSTQIMNKTIIKRYNHQSAMILSTSGEKAAAENANQNGTDDHSTGSAVKKARLHEVMEYEDLHGEDVRQAKALSLQKSERYSHGPTPLSEIQSGLSGHNVMSGLQVVAKQCSTYKPKLNQVLPSRNASAVLAELAPEHRSASSANDIALDHMLPEALQTDLQYLYASTSELLRHFWLCFPVNTPFLQEKVVRMHTSIEKFRAGRLDSFKQALAQERVEVNVAKHIEDMFDAASSKFSAWQSKNRKLLKK